VAQYLALVILGVLFSQGPLGGSGKGWIRPAEAAGFRLQESGLGNKIKTQAR